MTTRPAAPTPPRLDSRKDPEAQALRKDVLRELTKIHARLRELGEELDTIDLDSGGAPASAPFVTHAISGALTNERRLVNGTNTTVNTAIAGQIAIDAAAAYTDEQAQDAVGTILTDTATVNFTYNDGGPSIAADVIEGGLAMNAPQYVCLANTAALPNERRLVSGVATFINDGGAGSTVAVDSTLFVEESGGSGLVEGVTGIQFDETTGLVVDDSGNPVAEVRIGEVPLHTHVADEVLVDIDCTAQATNDWNAGGDGTYALGGFNWSIVNTGAVDTFGPVLTTGVRVNLSAVAATTYTTSTRTAPYFRIATTTLIPTWDPLGTYVIEVYLSSVTFGTSGDRIVIFLDYDWAGTDRMFAAGRRNASGTQETYATLDAAAVITATAATHDALALRVNPAGCAGLSGTYAAGFPPYTVVGGYQPSVATVGSAMHPSSFIGLAFMNGGAGGAMDCTVARIRVRRVRG